MVELTGILPLFARGTILKLLVISSAVRRSVLLLGKFGTAH
jgi:hypothetical protein